MNYLFGDCKLDMHLQALYRNSQAIHLQPRVFNLLVYLIEHRNRVVSRDELYEQIWPKQFIASATLESAIKLTRQAIGDSGRKQGMIKTFHKRGYRFIASVEQRQEPDSQEPSHSDHASGSTTRPQHMCLPFVGRQHELAILSAQLESATHGQGRAVVLSGECGIGKSRLLDEFQSRLSTQEVTRLQGSCLPSQTLSPYGVIRQLIRQCFDLGAGEGSDAIRTKVQTRLVEIGLNDIKMASSILDLVGFETRSDQIAVLPPERLMVRTMDMICQIFIASSRQHPLFIAVEDLQWIDPTSDNCIALLMAQIARAPILLLMTHSSAYQPRWEEEVTHLALTPLTEAHSHTIMHELSDQTQVPDHLRQAVVTAAAGNPGRARRCPQDPPGGRHHRGRAERTRRSIHEPSRSANRRA
jgi:DNA-binding winged helix-turn-helix (wHTH) protein